MKVNEDSNLCEDVIKGESLLGLLNEFMNGVWEIFEFILIVSYDLEMFSFLFLGNNKFVIFIL